MYAVWKLDDQFKRISDLYLKSIESVKSIVILLIYKNQGR